MTQCPVACDIYQIHQKQYVEVWSRRQREINQRTKYAYGYHLQRPGREGGQVHYLEVLLT